MCVWLLVATLVLGQAAPDPSALVKKLASSQKVEREEATKALEALGRDALPALRAAREAKDAELRTRVGALIEKIESGLLIKPTLVRLDFQDRPIGEIVKAINAQTHFRLALEPENDPAWQSQRVTLREPRPVPFWEALDRLTAAGQVRHDPGVRTSAGDTAPIFHLKAGSASFPKAFSGPFRVNLVSIHRGHDLAFGADDPAEDDPEAEPDLERFEVQVQVFAEPHLLISLNGPPKELRVRDDFDQDLVPPPPDPTEEMDAPPNDSPTARVEKGEAPMPGTLSIVQFPIALRAPDRPGTTIDRLEGFVPLLVASRKPNPLVVNLAEAPGKSFIYEDRKLTFPDAKPNAADSPAVEFFLKLSSAEAMSADIGPLPPDFPEPRPVDTLQNRLELLDATGRPLLWSVRDVEPTEEGDVRIGLVLSRRNGKAVPAQLRYYGLTQAAVEVPFKFTKIPMP